ncbi:MAG: hypothetical protein ACP5OO_02500 [Chloroflexia bacterium]
MMADRGTPQDIYPPRYIVWSTRRPIDLSDLFQKKWYLRQIILHGRSEDIRTLDLDDLAALLDELALPPDLHRLWKCFLEMRHRVAG